MADKSKLSKKEGEGTDQKIRKASLPHDEAFKKLLQTFFAEFIALFFRNWINCWITVIRGSSCRNSLWTSSGKKQS
ncbi:hypothetical protein, partial [Paenibacillus eucommiae]